VPLQFPEVQDIPLGSSPLAEVVFQIRFDPILRIANQQPADFHELIRGTFPKFDQESPVVLQFPNDGSRPAPVSVDIAPQLFRFLSRDKATAVSISTDFLAVSTLSYESWDQFSAIIKMALDAFVSTYSHVDLTRVGLRYVNNLVPKQLGLRDLTETTEVLNQALTAVAQEGPWDHVAGFGVQLDLGDGPGRTLAIRYGTRYSEDEESLVLDLDYYQIGEIETHGLVEQLADFHEKIYQAFRWSIRPDRITVFGPLEEGIHE